MTANKILISRWKPCPGSQRKIWEAKKLRRKKKKKKKKRSQS